jgi:hypothetical protein
MLRASYFGKLLLAREHVSEPAEILKREQISRATFMPTLDHVAADVRNRWLAAQNITLVEYYGMP